MVLAKEDYIAVHKLNEADPNEQFEHAIKAVFKASREALRLSEKISDGEIYNAEKALITIDSLILGTRYFKHALTAMGIEGEIPPVALSDSFNEFKKSCHLLVAQSNEDKGTESKIDDIS